MILPTKTSLRVMTYNVHGCVGLDFRRSEKRIAEVIAANNPDIVGLQELDLGRSRSNKVDQAQLIARHLGFHRYFHPAMRQSDEHYGDAILSRWPITLQKAGGLPSENAFLFRENRGALWVDVATPFGSLQIINTHLGLGLKERVEQVEALVGSEWLGTTECLKPLVMLGDFNSLPGSLPYRLVTDKLSDASVSQIGRRRPKTFPTPLPFLTIDYIFHNESVEIRNMTVGNNVAARYVSDHFPLIADLTVKIDFLPPSTHDS